MPRASPLFADAGETAALEETGTKRWQGLLAGEQRTVRRAVGAILCVLVVAMAAGQLSMFPAGESHVLLLLVPVALAALLFGKWRGCAVGALAGLAEMLHAILLPLDYFEKYFSSPLNSIALFALFGLLMGALFALACRLPRLRRAAEGARAHGLARMCAIAATSIAGALFATVFLQGGIYLTNTVFSAGVPGGLAIHGPAQQASSVRSAWMPPLSLLFAWLQTPPSGVLARLRKSRACA